MQNCYLFRLCLSFWLKVKKRCLFWKIKSGIFSFRVNDILTSILSALHPFLTLPNDDLKCEKGTFFVAFKRSHERRNWKRCSPNREKSTFLAVGSDILKSVKKVSLKSLKM